VKKLASDIKLVFHSSTITMMHGPINIRLNKSRIEYKEIFLVRICSRASAF